LSERGALYLRADKRSTAARLLTAQAADATVARPEHEARWRPDMALKWVREHRARWDAGKRDIIGSAPAGVFDARYVDQADGAPLSGDWWRVEDDGKTVAFGWLDAVWGDAEILLSVHADEQERGVGAFVLDRLAEEAAARGLNYVYNVVRPSHPDGGSLTRWLEARGFALQPDGRLTRRAETPPPKPAHGRIGWIDLTIPAADTARDFYAAVAGWSAEPVSMGDYADYTMTPAGGGDPVAGICHARGPNADMPAQWMIYIAVDDMQGALDRVKAHGGEILQPPGEGRPLAVIRDPAGAVFALWSTAG